MEAIWKNIKGSGKKYSVSNTGLVRNNKTGKLIKGSYNHDGYNIVGLRFIKGVRVFYSVHRLVANAFIRNHKNKPEVNHKDLDKSNNNASNLEWVNHKENGHHYMITSRILKVA